MRAGGASVVRLTIVALAMFTTVAVALHWALSAEPGSIVGESFFLYAAIPGAIIRSFLYGVHGGPSGDLNDWVLAVGSSLIWTSLFMGVWVGLSSILKHVRQGAA